jgi:PqqD family protein of HPr-rel-A system
MDLAGVSGDASDAWLVTSADLLEWREWDGELVVYLDGQGSTHVLTPYAGAVFLTLLQGPPDVHMNDLLARLAPDEEAQAKPPSREHVLQVMAEFERIGLVRRH